MTAYQPVSLKHTAQLRKKASRSSHRESQVLSDSTLPDVFSFGVALVEYEAVESLACPPQGYDVGSLQQRQDGLSQDLGGRVQEREDHGGDNSYWSR